jgi:hypothetical protein
MARPFSHPLLLVSFLLIEFAPLQRHGVDCAEGSAGKDNPKAEVLALFYR